MNSVKNAIVTMTLLAVGYGAYVVLSNPVPEDLGELAEGTVWQAPEVTTLATEGGGNVAVDPTAQSSSMLPNPESAVPPSDFPPPDDGETLPSDIASPWPSPGTASIAEELPPGSTSVPSDALANNNASSSTGPETTATDPGTNYYVSQSGAQPPAANAYPTTSAPATQLPANTVTAPPATQSAPAVTPDSSGTAGRGNPEFEQVWQTAQADLSSGQLGAALGTLSAWYEEASLSPEQQDRLIPLLDQLAGTVIYSRDSFLEPGHVVQQGDNLQDLAQQYQVPVEFLARINGIEPPHQLYPGETIKVVQGPFRAEVNCAERQITLFLGRYYAGRFPARIGPELPPEANTYEVSSIEPGLEYFDTRSGNRIARDDPDNPYGSVWISLRGNQITTAHRVGIHVDNGDPQRGCVGVSETDARDLAAILGPGSAIQVIP